MIPCGQQNCRSQAIAALRWPFTAKQQLPKRTRPCIYCHLPCPADGPQPNSMGYFHDGGCPDLLPMCVAHLAKAAAVANALGFNVAAEPLDPLIKRAADEVALALEGSEHEQR